MTSLDRGENFLDLSFDWFVLEQWDPTSFSSPREQHFRLGFAYAALGHKGRRPYFQRADNYREGDQVPRNPSEVPNDLLSPQERSVNSKFAPVWIRTDYGPGTDERHQVLLDAVEDDLNMIIGGDDRVLDDKERYGDVTSLDEPSDEDLSKVFAFVPILLEFPVPGFYGYDDVDWDAPELQEHFRMKTIQPEDPPDVRKDKQILFQRHFFVADREAMCSGWLLWVHVDEFGKVVQRNRVQPSQLQAIFGFKSGGLKLGEMNVGYEGGRLERWGYMGTQVGQWEPPAT